MPLATLDPRLLVPRGRHQPVRALFEDVGGRPAMIVFEGEPGAWADLERVGAPERRGIGELLRQAVALTVAVRPRGAAPLPSWLEETFDMVAASRAEAERWHESFHRSPEANLAATMLCRRESDDTWDGLVAESTTYSLLQASGEFRRWLGAREGGPPLARERGEDDAPRIRVTRLGTLVRVTLCRPSVHNALDRRLRDELHTALDPLRREPDTRVVIDAEGPSFCSGGDLGEFGSFPSPVAAHAIRLHRSLALAFSDLGPRMVVALHGSCLGAGIELPAFASRVVAADDARFGLPEGSLGLIPGAGGTVSIRRRIGRARLLEMLITGDALDAGTALDWGLVDEVVPARDLPARASAGVAGTSGRARLLGGAA